MNKKVTKKIAIALCGIALIGVGATSIIKENTYTASANNSYGTTVWVQYGTLKYDLRGPSGRVYRAGTKVVRRMYAKSKPNNSLPASGFYLTAAIGGTPGLNMIEDAGGGEVDERYVNMGDWTENDYPSESTTLVNNTMDDQDLASKNFHPVDPNNFDVPDLNRDALNRAFSDFMTDINWSKINSNDAKIRDDIGKRHGIAESMGTTQAYIDQLTSDIEKVVAQYKKTGHFSGALDNSETPTKPDTDKPANGDTTTNPAPTTTSKQSRYVRLRKASYRYTRKGKRVSRKLLKKGSVVKINGKVYRIKGKTFYRIAKNRYIRVVNTKK